MTLCGVLKNILLVVASIIFWGTIITGLQFFGYAIALVGLVYYGVGYEGVMTYWAVTADFTRRLLGIKEESLTGNNPKHFLMSKRFWFGLWVIVAGTLLVWIAARNSAIEVLKDKAKGI
jgi:hypothetical protein